MKEIIEVIARAIVDEAGFVSVTEIGGIHTSILELKVAKTDIGKVTGNRSLIQVTGKDNITVEGFFRPVVFS